MLAALTLSRLGLPASAFALPMHLALLLLALAALWSRRPGFPWRDAAPVGAVLLAAAVLSGWPMLRFGFEWIAAVNDDMANYCLGAQRFLHHGFYDPPDMGALIAGRDYSQAFWFFHVAEGVRPGSELLLAALWGLTGLSAQQLFMPVMVALLLCLICAICALAHAAGERPSSLLPTALLVATSALTTLAVASQLVAQMGGLAMLAAASAAAFVLLDRGNKGRLRNGVAVTLGVQLGALCVYYPEALPFFAAFAGVILFLHRETWLARGSRIAMAAAEAGGTVVLVVNTKLYDLVEFLFRQGAQGTATANLDLFPYFLVPTGFENFWGISLIGQVRGDPWGSLGILAGIVLLLACAAIAARAAPRGNPAAIMALVMLAVGAFLFSQSSGFGVFKLAMFLHPFLLAAVGPSLLPERHARLRRTRLALLAVLVIAGVHGQAGYLLRSLGTGMGGLTDLPHGSATAITAELRAASVATAGKQVVSETPLLWLAKIQALYWRQTNTEFLSRDFAAHRMWRSYSGEDSRAGAFAALYSQARGKEARFSLLDAASPDIETVFSPAVERPDNALLLMEKGPITLLNRSSADQPGIAFDGKSIRISPLMGVRDHLSFVNSSLGNHYYLARSRARAAYYAPERDWFFPGETMASLGRYALFEATNPSADARMLLEVSASYWPDGRNALPPAAVVGDRRELVGLVGRGAARMLAPRVPPRRIGAGWYLAIDLGTEARRMPHARPALMALFNAGLSLDSRRITVFGRDISLVSQASFDAVRPPARITRFPHDLANRHLLFSGIYEDGWVAEESLLRLDNPFADGWLEIAGEVPAHVAEAGQELAVTIDGRESARASLKAGAFNLIVQAPAKGVREIRLRFSRIAPLSDRDRREASARLKAVGFVNP